jgi:glutathione peroxidase-family protein
MFVNVASACGYTATNYAGMQARPSRTQKAFLVSLSHTSVCIPPQELYSALSPRGFSILAFPCDCFGNQEPGSDAEIAAFASDKYGVTFPLFSKIAGVNGDDAHPIFDWLKLQPGMDGDISWNFNKARYIQAG